VLDGLPVERLPGPQQVPADRPRVRPAARNLAVAEVLRSDTRVRGGPVELGRRLVEESGGRFEALSALVVHQSIFSATCFICVYSSIE